MNPVRLVISLERSVVGKIADPNNSIPNDHDHSRLDHARTTTTSSVVENVASKWQT